MPAEVQEGVLKDGKEGGQFPKPQPAANNDFAWMVFTLLCALAG